VPATRQAGEIRAPRAGQPWPGRRARRSRQAPPTRQACQAPAPPQPVGARQLRRGRQFRLALRGHRAPPPPAPRTSRTRGGRAVTGPAAPADHRTV